MFNWQEFIFKVKEQNKKNELKIYFVNDDSREYK